MKFNISDIDKAADDDLEKKPDIQRTEIKQFRMLSIRAEKWRNGY